VIQVASWIVARPFWQQGLIALVAGVCVTLALPPVYALPLLLVGFPIFLILLDGAARLRAVVGLGWLFGAGHMLSGLYWVGNALEIAGAPPQLAILLPLSIASFPALSGMLYWLISRMLKRRGWLAHGDIVAAMVFALCWLAGEWLRGNVFTGFPWNLVGYSWAFSDTLSQGASVVGIYGLSFLTVLLAACPLTLMGQNLRRPAAWLPIGMALVVLGGTVGFGWERLATAGDPQFHDIRVRIVQSNIDQKDKWAPERRTENFVRHLILSEKSGAEEVDLLIWPETAVPFYLDEDPGRTVMMGRIIKPGGVVVTGVPRREILPDRSRRFYNSLLVIGSDGVVRDTFDKFHLVPFGEYVPFYGLLAQLGIEKLVAGAGDFSSGPGPRLIELPGLPSMSPLICYEVIFPGEVLPEGPRPGFMLNLTNDAWYGKTSGPYQHLMIARFRAIEEGLPMLRAAGTGISAIIDPYGRVVRQLGLGKAGVVDGLLPVAISSPPLFAQLHGWAVLGLLMLTLLLILVGKAVAWRVDRRQSAA
jgi:apolipoprotein N-acyltransferase